MPFGIDKYLFLHLRCPRPKKLGFWFGDEYTGVSLPGDAAVEPKQLSRLAAIDLSGRKRLRCCVFGPLF